MQDGRLRAIRNIHDLRDMARRRLPSPLFDFLDGGAEDEVTLRRNTDAFDRWDLVPRYLADVSAIDTSTTVVGQRIAWPVILSPTGMSRFFHKDGERAVALACADSGTT